MRILSFIFLPILLLVYLLLKAFFITLVILMALGFTLVALHNVTGLAYPTFSEPFYISLVLIAFILSFLIPFKIEEILFPKKMARVKVDLIEESKKLAKEEREKVE